MKQLVPYVMHRHDISEKIIEYIDKTGIKKEILESILQNEFKMTRNRVENMIGMADAINQDESLSEFLSFMENISHAHLDTKKDYIEDFKYEMRKSSYFKDSKPDTTSRHDKKDYKTKRKPLELKHKRKSNS